MAAKIGAAASLPHFSFFGSSSMTIMASRGLSAGAKPTNERTPGAREYRRVAGSIFCAVPVLPATACPAMAAFRPVPCATTLVIMAVSVRAASADITWRTTRGSKVRTSRPSASRRARTSWGCMNFPPFATAEKDATICSAVTEISCPIDRVARERPDHRFGGRSCPRLSPGSPTPVSAPKPKPVMYLW